MLADTLQKIVEVLPNIRITTHLVRFSANVSAICTNVIINDVKKRNICGSPSQISINYCSDLIIGMWNYFKKDMNFSVFSFYPSDDLLT